MYLIYLRLININLIFEDILEDARKYGQLPSVLNLYQPHSHAAVVVSHPLGKSIAAYEE
jgi:hypothetical protein